MSAEIDWENSEDTNGQNENPALFGRSSNNPAYLVLAIAVFLDTMDTLSMALVASSLLLLKLDNTSPGKSLNTPAWWFCHMDSYHPGPFPQLSYPASLMTCPDR